MSGQQGTYNVDIVMCIDKTGSMSPIIERVKASALSFYDQVVDAMEESGRNIDQLRLKLISFGDFDSDAEPMVETAFYSQDQIGEFKSSVNSIVATGGGDIPENALEAIALALKSDWTTGGTGRRHVIVVFTDAPALPFGERSGSANYPSGMPKDIAQLGAWWEGTDQSFSSTYQLKAGRLVIFAPDAEPCNVMSTWNRVTFFPSKAGEGMDEYSMAEVIQLIVKSMA